MIDTGRKNIPHFNAVAIGNALCDIEVSTSIEELKKINAVSGSMSLVDIDRKNVLEKYFYQDIVKRSSGGSAANSTSHMQKMGLTSAFIGTITDDENGNAFLEDFSRNGVSFLGKKIVSKSNAPTLGTGSCLVLSTEDGQRTMFTYLGCASQFLLHSDNQAAKVNTLEFTSDILFIEGYTLDDGENTKAIKNLADNARKNGALIAMSASDSSYLKLFPDTFSAMANYCDILFCNAEELKALTNASNKQNISSTKELLKSQREKVAPLTVVTDGENGAYFMSRGEISFSPSEKVKPLDTNGAGDAFAAAVLSGYYHQLKSTQDKDSHANLFKPEEDHNFNTKKPIDIAKEKLDFLISLDKKTIEKIARAAHKLAAKIITVYGARHF